MLCTPVPLAREEIQVPIFLGIDFMMPPKAILDLFF